jgi:hypothetical protein
MSDESKTMTAFARHVEECNATHKAKYGDLTPEQWFADQWVQTCANAYKVDVVPCKMINFALRCHLKTACSEWASATDKYVRGDTPGTRQSRLLDRAIDKCIEAVGEHETHNVFS